MNEKIIKSDRWEEDKKWNPFMSEKLFAHIPRWKEIERGKRIPAPVFITVDPTNLCGFDCVWCNAKKIRTERQVSLSFEALSNIAEFIPKWGVEAVCVAGGGEPLLNQATEEFIEKSAFNGLDVGVITNGSNIEDFMLPLSKCTWVSVSVDAGTPETHHRLKKTPQRETFAKILADIAGLIDYAKAHGGRLSSSRPAYGVTYKYLLHPGNIGEVFQAAKLAKSIGCKNICYRPAVTPQHKLITSGEIEFSQKDISLYKEQMSEAMELDDKNFNVYEYTYRVGPQFEKNNCFEKCFSIFMAAIIQPPQGKNSPKDSFTLGLCCDRRGDGRTELLQDAVDVEEIREVWGSQKHWGIHDRIDQESQCPQCTHVAHNRIYEQVIQNDILTYNFI